MDPIRRPGGGAKPDGPSPVLLVVALLLPLALITGWVAWKLQPTKQRDAASSAPPAAIDEPLPRPSPEGTLEGAWAPAPSAGEATADIQRVGGGVEPPQVISRVQPVYPEVARLTRVQGVVIVEAVIDEHGDVKQVRVLKGLPMGLDTAAVDAIRRWKFKPATFDGRPVSVYFTLTVNFKVQ